MKRNNAGSTLVEIVVAMAILGAFSVSACTSLVLGLRLNDKAESMLQAQLAVSYAVETLMAKGITVDENDTPVIETHFPNTEVNAVRKTDDENQPLPFFEVTVKSTQEDVSVTTYIREVAAE